MNPLTIKARSLARRTGLIRLIYRLLPGRNEDRFLEALKAAVKPGDVAWDVGANVGVYSELLCGWVGPEGFVVAFESLAQSAEAIRRRIPDCPWLRVENVALGDSDELGRIVLTSYPNTTHLDTGDRDTGDGATAANTLPIQVYRGDSVCERLGKIPNVIKIDVEGFEEEVLTGLDRTLSSAELSSVLVEVHFRVLEQRGRADAPARLEKLLRGKGFATKWLDASHLKAEKVRSR